MRVERRFVELETQARRALVHDPGSPDFKSCVLVALLEQQRHEEAAALGSGWLAESSDAAVALATGIALLETGRVEGAFDVLERHAADLRGLPDVADLATVAIEMAVQSRSLDPTLRRLEGWLSSRNVPLLRILAPIAAEIARALVARGSFPTAVHFVRLARVRGLSDAQVRGDPELRPLHGFPSFERLFRAPDPDDEPGDDGPLNI